MWDQPNEGMSFGLARGEELIHMPADPGDSCASLKIGQRVPSATANLSDKDPHLAAERDF